MPLSEHLPKVFISHSWMDKRKAVEIGEGIKNFAHVWIDFEKMVPGTLINETIQNELKKMDYVLLIWTKESVKNKNVQNEIRWANSLGVPIIQCYFDYEENGGILPTPNGESKLKFGLDFNNVLGIDFRKLNQGLARLLNTLQKATLLQLPKEIQDKFLEKANTMNLLEQLNGYLVNYRNIKNKSDDRKFWINKISALIDGFIASGEDKELIDNLMDGLYELKSSDPEAFEALQPKIDQYFSQKNNSGHSFQYQLPYAAVNPFQNQVIENLRKNFIEMVQNEGNQANSYQLLSNHFPDLTQIQKVDLIQTIINITADGINLLNQAYILAQQAGMSNEFNPILNYVTEYFFQVEDFRNDNYGPLGWVDDSYLCLSSLQQINHVYYSIFQRLLINVDFNPCLQYLMQSLDQNELYQLDNALKTKFSSINWNNLLIRMGGFTMNNMLFGHHQVNQNYGGGSWGGSWEDQMAERAARLGISINI